MLGKTSTIPQSINMLVLVFSWDVLVIRSNQKLPFNPHSWFIYGDSTQYNASLSCQLTGIFGNLKSLNHLLPLLFGEGGA